MKITPEMIAVASAAFRKEWRFQAVIAAVAPLILEEAAKVADEPARWRKFEGDFEANSVAAAIRALAKEA